MKHLLFFSLLLLTTPIFSQIKVEDVGDGWKNKIELALDKDVDTDNLSNEELKNMLLENIQCKLGSLAEPDKLCLEESLRLIEQFVS